VISDCGNKIKSVKFLVYRCDDGSGLARVAAQEASLPHPLTREHHFSNTEEMIAAIKSLHARVRKYEDFKQQREPNTEGVYRFLCLECNTIIPQDQIAFIVNCGRAYVTCPCCGNDKLEFMKTLFRRSS